MLTKKRTSLRGTKQSKHDDGKEIASCLAMTKLINQSPNLEICTPCLRGK